MRFAFLLLFLLLSKISFGQDSAFIHISEEKNYPSDAYTQTAQKQYTWFINGVAVNYHTGVYSIPLNAAGSFDTIRFENRFTETIYTQKGKAKKVSDTASFITLCRFRKDHHYSLSQIYPGWFEFFSLDTFESSKKLVLKITGVSTHDTLYLEPWFGWAKIYSDTVLTFDTPNEKMQQHFNTHVALTRTRPVMACYSDEPPPTYLLDVELQYLHAETFVVEYDLATKQYQLKIAN